MVTRTNLFHGVIARAVNGGNAKNALILESLHDLSVSFEDHR